jgi:hypothetical protein
MRTVVITVHLIDPSIHARLDAIDRQLARLCEIGEYIMAQNAELKAFLEQLNVYTNDIAKDIDDLLAMGAGGQPLSDEDRAAMQATSDTLKGIAAKSGDPLPAPIEPAPPV